MKIEVLKATQIFNQFPGSWEVRQTAFNLGAQAFWRKAISPDFSRYVEKLTIDLTP